MTITPARRAAEIFHPFTDNLTELMAIIFSSG
jgi:hypothetical protein